MGKDQKINTWWN